ncbi:hypothetical protein BDV33DRAFT_65374 [Aspergillus novoparasiticus]|uniref:Uncharacterized protein n=1 Tax=Aspergillus novoparasiticus TaxID=986946 RepID=A0A5N6F029_9EURO|nr:hypothetical protein BDV33DRAFT_65374 [Aspergillus novoparasiticus]
MTETCAGSIFNTKCLTYDKERNLDFTSVGTCMLDIKMRITDGSNSAIAPADVVGNLEISGPVVFKSLFNNPTATEESFSSDGWFKTGDKGSIDEIGYLTLQGLVPKRSWLSIVPNTTPTRLKPPWTNRRSLV